MNDTLVNLAHNLHILCSKISLQINYLREYYSQVVTKLGFRVRLYYNSANEGLMEKVTVTVKTPLSGANVWKINEK